MRVAELYRYPVKSMQGERLMNAALTAAGIPGDRAWALQDEVQGGITGAKKLPRLMSMEARFIREPDEETRSPEVRIRDGNGLAVSSASGDVDARLRRFRPNVLLDVDDEGFVENAWAGRTLRIGEPEVTVAMPCPRCIMTTVGFDDLPRDPRVMRALVRHNGGNLGVYASVSRGSRVRVGDTASLG